MTSGGLTRTFIALRALRWLHVGIVLPFLVIIPQARGLSLSAIGVVFAVHSAVALALEVPSGALADLVGRRRVLLAGAALSAASLLAFVPATGIAAFCGAIALLAAGRALISGALEAWYVDTLRLLDPVAPLARGLSAGTAAEGVAMAFGALVGGAIVAVSGYSAALLAGAAAALLYLGAVAVLVREPSSNRPHRPEAVRDRAREVFATARREAAGSVTVQVVFLTAVAFGVSMSAVELLWQPRLAALVGTDGKHGVGFGALVAASMLAVALGAALSPRLNRRLGLARGYVLAMVVAALFVAGLGAPTSPLGFAVVYLCAYLAFGVADPMHFELLNDAVGATARATLISAESLATQGGALVANLSIGGFAAAHGVALAWAAVGAVLALSAGGAVAALGIRGHSLLK